MFRKHSSDQPRSGDPMHKPEFQSWVRRKKWNQVPEGGQMLSQLPSSTLVSVRSGARSTHVLPTTHRPHQ